MNVTNDLFPQSLVTHVKSLVVTFESSSALTTARVTMKVNTPVSPEPPEGELADWASFRRMKRCSSAISSQAAGYEFRIVFRFRTNTAFPIDYRVTHLLGKNLPLTWFRQFWQLVGSYCSCLLPKQDGVTSQIIINERFFPF